MSLLSCEGPLSQCYDAVLFDLDGVVYVSAEPVPEAVGVLNRLTDSGPALAYITNNASRTPETVAAHLRDLGVAAAADDVVTSAQAIAQVMAAELAPSSPVLVVGGEGLHQALAEVGLSAARAGEQPVAAVQGYFPQVAWADLAELAYAVQDGAWWYVSNTDLTVPTARGIAPGNGSLVQAVQNATRVPPRAIAGKPHRPLFDVTVARLGAQRPLMVGDRLDTDVAGARAAGLASLAVLTGVSTVADLASAPLSQRPDYVAPDLRGALAAHPPVQVSAAQARCGAALAQEQGGRVAVVRQGTPLEELRAVVALAWSIADESGSVPDVDGTLDP